MISRSEDKMTNHEGVVRERYEREEFLEILKCEGFIEVITGILNVSQNKWA